MYNILVTGGLGYIGSHTCVELLYKNYKITIIDSLVNSSVKTLDQIKEIIAQDSRDLIQNLNFEIGDIRDSYFLDNLFHSAIIRGSKFDGVMHFCGLKSVRESMQRPLNYWDVNILGTINLLNIMEKYRCYSLVFSSSATVYGNCKKNPIPENAEIKPVNTYGETKATIEKILFDLHRQYSSQFKLVVLRYFNPVGAHSSGLIGDSPLDKPNNVFPILNKVANSKTESFAIFGNDWPTRDGTCIRDYIHISDLAYGHALALDFLFKNEPQLKILNLGTGIGTTVLELQNTFKKVNDLDFHYIFKDKREGDVSTLIADNSLTKKTLNWEPKINLEKMCRDSWNFFLKSNFL